MSIAPHTMRLLAMAGFVSGLSIRLAEPLLAEAFAVDVADAAYVVTGFALAYGLFQLVHGPLGDRLGKLRMIAFMSALAGLLSAACVVAGTAGMSWCGYALLAALRPGAIIPLSFSFVGDNVAFAQRQAVLGRFIGGILLGQLDGPVLGGVLSDWIGWRAVFTVPAVGFLLVSALLAPCARGEERRAPSASSTTRYRRKQRRWPLKHVAQPSLSSPSRCSLGRVPEWRRRVAP